MILFFKLKFFNLREQAYVIRNFYHRPRFAARDLLLGISSLFFNPYRICKTTYGETPLSTFCKMAAAVNLCSQDHYLELGSGRGKSCFWASVFIGCAVTGVEQIPLFVRLSKALFKGVHFVNASMYETDLSKADVIYYYHLDEKRPLFETMRPGARLITISQPIESETFRMAQSIEATFPWGKTRAFIHYRI